MMVFTYQFIIVIRNSSADQSDIGPMKGCEIFEADEIEAAEVEVTKIEAIRIKKATIEEPLDFIEQKLVSKFIMEIVEQRAAQLFLLLSMEELYPQNAITIELKNLELLQVLI